MPKRMIDTAMWSDDRFGDLSAKAKLTYVRLITGDDTNAAGANCARPARLAVDLSLTPQEVEVAIEELADVGLVKRYETWMWMPTWIAYQVTSGPFIAAARRDSKSLPPSLAKAVSRTLNERFSSQRKGKKREYPQTGSAETRTETIATSREDFKPPPSLSQASGKPSSSDRDRDRGKEGFQPSVLAPIGTRNPAAPPEPSPGAQAPPPGVNGEEPVEVVSREEHTARLKALTEKLRRPVDGGPA